MDVCNSFIGLTLFSKPVPLSSFCIRIVIAFPHQNLNLSVIFSDLDSGYRIVTVKDILENAHVLNGKTKLGGKGFAYVQGHVYYVKAGFL